MTRVVERVLVLMECFDEEKPSLPLHEISTRAKLPKPTTFRLLAALIKAGYLIQQENQEYALSPKIMRLAAVAQRSFSVRDVARPVMLEVLSSTGETVDLSVLNGAQRFCIDVLNSPHPLKNIITPGQTVELAAGASGKLLLAYNESQLLAQVLKKGGRGIDREGLKRDLAMIRTNGYAHTRGERVEGVEGISVPLRDHRGLIQYSLTLTGPTFRFAEREAELIEVMKKAGDRISHALGGTVLTATAVPK